MILLVTKTLEMTHSKLNIEGRAYAKIKKTKNQSIMLLNFRKQNKTGNSANNLNTAFFIYL